MKTLITITGPSGSGKSMVQDYIANKYGFTPIHSMTTREQRDESDIHHEFITIDEVLSFPENDLIGHDLFPGIDGKPKHYTAHKRQFKDKSVYVIEENGLVEIFKRMTRNYNVFSLYIQRPLQVREDMIDAKRIARDKGQLQLPNKAYDMIINNDGNLEKLYEQVDAFMKLVENNKPNIFE